MTQSSALLNEQWAYDLSVRIEVLRRLKEGACAGSTGNDVAAKTVDLFLEAADEAVRCRPRGKRQGRSMLDHWRGLSVARAYENVHAAEVFLVDLLTADQLEVLMPAVVARAEATLDPDDPRRRDIHELSERHDLGDPACRAHVKQAMRAGFAAEDQIFLRVRTFRNLVVKCTGLLVLFIIGMIVVVAGHPASMPLCFVPDPAAPMVCPSAHASPSSEDIFIVVGLGLLGSSAAAAFAIRGLHAMPTPYDVPVALAVFKLPLGAFTAVTGLLLLGGDFVPGLSELDSQRQILAYALTFGYAQQLVSRLVDNRARELLKGLPAIPAPRREHSR